MIIFRNKCTCIQYPTFVQEIDETIKNQQQEIHRLQQLVLHLEEQHENEHKRISMVRKVSQNHHSSGSSVQVVERESIIM